MEPHVSEIGIKHLRVLRTHPHHDFTVSPDTFNIIKQAALFIEYVNDDITIVHQNPVDSGSPLPACTGIGFAKLFFFYVVGHGLNLVFRWNRLR